jgi:hypothetical protein
VPCHCSMTLPCRSTTTSARCSTSAMANLKAALRMVLVVNAYYEEEIRRLKNEASSGPFGEAIVCGEIQKLASTSTNAGARLQWF